MHEDYREVVTIRDDRANWFLFDMLISVSLILAGIVCFLQ